MVDHGVVTILNRLTMEGLCGRGEIGCETRVLTAALHALHFYCAALAATLIVCCAPAHPPWVRRNCTWRGQNVRGTCSMVLLGVLAAEAAACALRASSSGAVRLTLPTAALALPAWLAAAVLHAALWSRRAAAPLLYLALYWMLAALSAAAQLFLQLRADPDPSCLHIYTHAASLLLSLAIAAVDCVCFYDEITKRFSSHNKSSTQTYDNVGYKHNDVHVFSKITFFWINRLLYRGFHTPLEKEDLGGLPDKELSLNHYNKFKTIYAEKVEAPSLWRCYIAMVWPNFYLAGLLKLLSDLTGVIPPLGLGFIIQFIEGHKRAFDFDKPVSLDEFLNNGYVMLFVVTLALIAQGLLSQNSTHLVTVEGTRLKTALQALIYDKCMKLSPWAQSSVPDLNEDCPLLHKDSEPTPSGLLTNLVAQDTYNIMSCVWICHYMWAIPLKISLILYLLYTKLGFSAIIGTLVTIAFITPLQFYLGKKISDNSKGISKCTDHRISKMAEILQGINVIKLYVWEDLFKEKILNLREVELKLLNKDTVYWNLLTFSTQASTILVTVISFTAHYLLGSEDGLPAMNVFAGLALFNQLTVPLLILPVTVLMFIQAMVSTRRIEEFLELPESNNNTEEAVPLAKPSNDTFNKAFIGIKPKDDKPSNKEFGTESEDVSDEGDAMPKSEIIVQLRNAVFSWGHKSESSLLEVDNLDIPSGKLIMVVGPTGSGKSSFLSALLGEMHLERGEMIWIGPQSTWYSGQPPWLVEGSVRDNILMGSAYSQRRYARVIRATALKPDLQLLPEGDATVLCDGGAPLSGGQRVRVAVARALYARSRVVALDEPLAALDAALARHVVARALLPHARSHANTVLLATNRLELLHYADMVIVVEDGRVVGATGPDAAGGAVREWARAAARAVTARRGAGTVRERERLVRAAARRTLQRRLHDDPTVEILEVRGSHLVPEVARCGRGSWRRRPPRLPPAPAAALTRQLSSPPAHLAPMRPRRDVRRALSADAHNARVRRDASLVRRLLRAAPPHRWTPKPLRRLLITDVENPEPENLNGKVEDSMLESTYASLTSNGADTNAGSESEASFYDKYAPKHYESECGVWWEYIRACGAGAAVYSVCACAAQGLAAAADWWLAQTANMHPSPPAWEVVVGYSWRMCVCAACWAAAALGGGAAGGAARRVLHERLLHAALHAPPAHHAAAPVAAALHRHAHDVAHIDKKLPTALSRWAQLALLCTSALLVNAAAAPWSLVALLPSVILYFAMQNVYLKNARELQRLEARSAAPIVALVCETCAGAATIRAARLQTRLRDKFLARLDDNHNALLMLNSANRWLGLSMDLMGAVAVFVCLGLAVCGGSSAGLAGLAGAHALLLPAYLAHLAKCRADLDIHLAAVERVLADINVPQEDYREDYPIPPNWQRSGKIVFENVTIHHDGNVAPILSNVNFTIEPGEKIVICGRSGSGKSTLLGACVGASGRVTNGRILVDGADASRLPLRALRHCLVAAPQDAALFSGTLRENIDPLAVHTDAEIWNALTIVNLHDFVTAQPAGLECTISPGNGSGWSAGRAARLCIARAVVAAGNSAALLLDEPAATLDAAADKALRRALENASVHRTTVTVAHRMSSIREYSRALLVSNGRVYEQNPGSPAVLDSPTTQDDLKNIATSS